MKMRCSGGTYEVDVWVRNVGFYQGRPRGDPMSQVISPRYESRGGLIGGQHARLYSSDGEVVEAKTDDDLVVEGVGGEIDDVARERGLQPFVQRINISKNISFKYLIILHLGFIFLMNQN